MVSPSEALQPLNRLRRQDQRQFAGRNLSALRAEDWQAWYLALLSDRDANLTDGMSDTAESDAG
jgi:hypothetical protein